MTFKNNRVIVVSSTVLITVFLAGCSFPSEFLLPSLTGEAPSSDTSVAKSQPTKAPQTPTYVQPPNQPPTIGTSKFEPNGVTSGSNTGTFVGQKAIELRNELRRLQANISKNNGTLQTVRGKIVQDSQNYHGAVSAINARLQVGTTPGNPVLVGQFNQALSDLKKIGDDISNMNLLTTNVTADSTLAAFLAENTRAAYRLSGAIDADHQQLSILEDEVNRTVVLIDRLLKELTEDIQRQTNYVSTERSNLNTLSAAVKSGELMGSSLTNRALTAATSGTSNRRATSRSLVGRRPLVVIRFNRANVAYDQALYNAVSRILERRPSATFELVAVAPALGGAARVALNSNKARRNAESVMRSLQRMGLPPQRIAVSARTSQAAQSNEVHLYLN
ncbi:MAG: hypothetical protein ACKVIK_03825 [Rhodospirillales bacterium]|jgi:hypothetical protein